jgi:hypothetical protein
MPMVALDAVDTKQIREGRHVTLNVAPGNGLIALLEPDGRVFSIARLLGNVVSPECVIPEGAS